MQRRLAGKRVGAVLGTAIALCLLVPTGAGAKERTKSRAMVPSSYFSVAFDYFVYDFDAARWGRIDRALARLRAHGIRRIRVGFSWRDMEPSPPGLFGHTYLWGGFDRFVGMAAKRGIRTNAMFGYVPDWAGNPALTCGLGAHSRAPKLSAQPHWSAAVHQFARRYGRGGTFWQIHPELRRQPIVSYEIWNEPNLWPYWCPKADPATYATFLSLAADSLHGVDPRARVVFGGMPSGNNADPTRSLTAATFVRRAIAARPGLVSKLSAVALHPYAYGPRSTMFASVVDFRRALRTAGVPDRMPIQITEAGWPRYGPRAFTEAERVRRYRKAVREVARLNCNVNGFTAYAWLTPELDPNARFDWHGLASPQTLKRYPAGVEMTRSANLMRGKLRRHPPKRPIRACAGMPAMDRDRDGLPDFRDPRPLRPRRR